MHLFQNKYRTQSRRLSGWDYSADGYYSVTICTQNRENIFGKIENGKMILNGVGKIVAQFWREIPTHFANAKLDEWVVMPNHLHGILVIDDANSCRRNAINRVSTTTTNNQITTENKSGGITGSSNPMGKKSLGEIIRYFKGKCSFEIHKIHPALDRIWQSRFYDRIIPAYRTGRRDENELNRIREYICQNPENWEKNGENLNFQKCF